MPLTIFFSNPGTYYIEDDGIRGNNMSVIKDANGVVLFPFTHPGDTLDFIAEVPGITFVFNTADSFGTANVNVGSLTDTSLTPDHIIINQMRTDAFMSLAADLTITERGADAAADVIAAGVVMSAGTGVGTAGNAIETQITFIEAETNTGGINIVNSGSVQIGGLTGSVAGLDVATSGDINFTTTGFILAADATGTQSIHGGDISGNVTLTALGADSDIFSNINNKMIGAAGGGITLNAGRDVFLGTSGTNFDNDLLATTYIRINAGRDFQIDGTSDVRTGAYGGVVGGAIDIHVGRNINLSNLTGGLQTIQAFAGDVTFITGPGGVFFETAAFPGAVQTTDDIVLIADNVQINSGGLNTTGVGSVTILPVTAGRAIDLGTALDGPAALGLSDDEFDVLFTLNVKIGDTNSGPVDFTAPLSPFIVDNLEVTSGTDIYFRSTLSLPRMLTLRAGDDITFSAASSFSSTNEGLLLFVDNAQNDGGFGGLANLLGTTTVNTVVTVAGNSDNDTLNGNSAVNVMYGNGGNDTLRGFSGNDLLDGGTGVDTLIGGLGNDVFYVDSASDLVTELAGEGTDRVAASVSYALQAGISIETLETLTLTDTTAINLSGNALNQSIIGNNGNNLMVGGGGNDNFMGAGGDDTIIGNTSASTMNGGAGNDTYFVYDTSDAVIEASGGGNDRVAASVSYTLLASTEIETLEAAMLTSTTALNFTGNVFVNLIIGNNGANVLDGKGGMDTLNGAGGADTFAFTTALGAGNVDTILGFVSGQDKIGIEDSIFTGIMPGALNAGAFFVGVAAGDADDRIIYNSATGALYYDSDGTGAAAQVQFATLSGHPALAGSDFLLI